MKIKLLSLLLAFITAFTFGCSGYTIISDNPKDLSFNKKYSNIVIAWMDLGMHQWKDLHYENEADWKYEADLVINDDLPKHLKRYLPRKKLTFLKDDNMPSDGDLFVKFNVKKIINNHGFGGGTVELKTDVIFVDVKENKEIYRAYLEIKEPAGYTYYQKLSSNIRFVAQFIANKCR